MRTELLGVTAAQIMERIETDELPENWRIEEVMVIAAVSWPVEDEDASGNSVFYRCTSALPWVQYGLLHQTRRAISNAIQDLEDE